MIRGIVNTMEEGPIKVFSAYCRVGELLEGREYMQHYGYTSRPLPGAEGVIIKEGGHYLMVASDDRRYRIPIESGEVCIYTDEGDHIRWKRGMEIYVKSGNKLTADITNEAVINAPLVIINASDKISCNTPLLEVSGNITSGADIKAAGEVMDAGGAKKMSGMREVFDAHVHPDADGGTTGVPTEGM